MYQYLTLPLLASFESEGTEKNPKGSLAEGLTGTFQLILDNPVRPSEFDPFDPTSAVKRQQQIANKNSVPLAKEVETKS